MAKSKASDYLTPRVAPTPRLVTSEDKKFKEGGKVYRLSEDYTSSTLVMLSQRTKLVECNDGWYAVVVSDNRTHLRIGPKRMNELKEILHKF